MKFNKILRLSILGIVLTGIAIATTSVHAVSAATRSYGVDWSKYQGNYGVYGQAKDTFAIAQIGGTYGGAYYVDQYTYNTQVSSAIAAGKYAHTYIWYQVGGSTSVAKRALDRYLPRIKTPKGSIVALDYEAGASGSKSANTAAILYGMKRIKAAGYTPMYYSYKPYTVAHVDYNKINRAYPNSLWIAAYVNYQVSHTPNYNYFPSLPGIAIWQFTSTYKAGGLDGNVDLIGITKSGYTKTKNSKGKATVKPKTTTSATKAGTKANKTKVANTKAGMTVKVKFSARHWATGQAIPSWVLGKTYKVASTSGSKVLLSGINSWIAKTNVELVGIKRAKTSANTVSTQDYAQRGLYRPSYTVNVRTGMGTGYHITGQLGYGDHILYNHVYIRGGIVWARYMSYTGTRYVALGINGGQSYGSRTGVSAASTATVSHTYYTVKNGDSFWSIGNKYGVSMYTIAQHNGMSVNHVIHPGQTLLIK